jgi:hypothetical protein
MARGSLILLLALAAAGCVASRPPEATTELRPEGTQATVTSPALPQRPATNAGEVAVSVVGTPFLLAFKAVVCAGSLVIAAPTAAVIALADGPASEGVEVLGDGVARNCGPPYILTPHGV